MPKIKLFSILSILVAMSLLVSGCGSPDPANLTDEQVTAITENILTAIDAGDYAAFSRDFSDEMLNAFPEDNFLQTKDMLASASGNYISIDTPTISNKQGYALYQFVCKYENEDVAVTVVFLVGGDKVDGLFFNSPNLIAASQK